MSSAVALVEGIPSGSIATNPLYFALSPIFTTAQCSATWPATIDYLLVTDDTAAALRANPACTSHFDFAGERSYTSEGHTLVLLPRSTLRAAPQG